MALSHFTGSQFKKMVMRASGTKGYVSGSVQKHLQASGTSKYLKSGSKITKQQATKVMRGLKEQGLVRKVNTDATKYVKKEFAHEERRQEMIKKQNVSERAKEIASEKAAEAQKGSNKTPDRPTAGTTPAVTYNQPATGGTVSVPPPTVPITPKGTNLKTIDNLPKAVAKPKQWEEEDKNIIDLAID